MSKAQTIAALIESAIDAFSRYGFEGASLRDIAANAGVPLGTIHMYFGSKADLFWAVDREVWAEIDRDRTALLNAALAKGERVRLEDLIYALAEPVVRRAVGHSQPELSRIQLLRCTSSARRLRTQNNFQEVADQSVSRWIDAMERICAPLPRNDVVWAFSFVVGAVYSWQLLDHRYDAMLGGVDERTAQAVTDDVVAFAAEGVRAMIGRRVTGRV
jgi:AcrR family transcriptional regulator